MAWPLLGQKAGLSSEEGEAPRPPGVISRRQSSPRPVTVAGHRIRGSPPPSSPPTATLLLSPVLPPGWQGFTNAVWRLRDIATGHCLPSGVRVPGHLSLHSRRHP